jgi:hypothetical protein
LATGVQIDQTLKNPCALSRVSGELMNVATDVLAEDPATAKHAERLKFANAILTYGADGHARKMLTKLLSLPAASSRISDLNAPFGLVDEAVLGTAIKNGLASIFTQFAEQM